MCGIMLRVLENELCAIFDNLSNLNSKRGPDSHSSVRLKSAYGTIEMHGWVLNLRGKSQQQPLRNIENNQFLLFNGEIYDGIKVSPDENDCKVLGNLLFNCKSREDILRVVSKIQGEFSLIFYHYNFGLFFCRDFLGRRSLLGAFKNEKLAGLSSVSDGQNDWKEISTLGVYYVDIKDPEFLPVLLEWNKVEGLTCFKSFK